MSLNPARRLGLESGRLAVGAPAMQLGEDDDQVGSDVQEGLVLVGAQRGQRLQPVGRGPLAIEGALLLLDGVAHVLHALGHLGEGLPQRRGHGVGGGRPLYVVAVLPESGTVVLGGRDECLATGMRAIHAIPAVCAAPPGLLSALDLPLITGRGLYRAPE